MRRTVVAAVLAGASLAAAGCSSGSSGSTVTTPTGGSTQTVTTKVTTSAPAPASTPPTSTASVPTSTPPAPTTSSPAATGPTTCATSALRLGAGQSNGAAGTDYITYTLTNAGLVTCTLSGYPGVSVLDSSGQVVQKAAVRRAGLAPTTARGGVLTLKQGDAVSFTVSAADTDPDPRCTGIRSGPTLRVYPPNTKVAIEQRAKTYQACELYVGPVFQR